MRIGQGLDAHAFADGRPLMLGCVLVEHPRGLAGHSDGDALAHAIVDALLGAAALGDIGAMFPSGDARWQDASGAELLRIAAASVREAGHRIASVDGTVIAEAPRLAPHVARMRRAVADALAIAAAEVSIKATTTDGMGFAGRGEGIAALAVVLLE